MNGDSAPLCPSLTGFGRVRSASHKLAQATETDATRATASQRPAIPKSPMAYPRMNSRPLVDARRRSDAGNSTISIEYSVDVAGGRRGRWYGRPDGSFELERGPFAHRADHRDPHDRGGADGVRAGNEDSGPCRPTSIRPAVGDPGDAGPKSRGALASLS